MSGAGARAAERSGSGGGGAGPSRGRGPRGMPPLSSPRASSYPSGAYEEGLLQKLLHRRRSLLPPEAPLSSAQLRRNRDKLVALLEEGQYALLEDPAAVPGAASPQASPVGVQGLAGAGDEDLLPVAVEETFYAGSITIQCTAASYDLKGLREDLEARGYECTQFPEVLCSSSLTRAGEAAGEIFFFDFGVACFWDLPAAGERRMLEGLLKGREEGALALAKVESDTFSFRLLPYSKPSIQNDCITLSPTMLDADLMKLSITFALAQSTKLSVLEERALTIASATRRLPNQLAKEGKVRIKDRAVAKLMGRVFIEQAALNLLGSVLDTPDFFWEPGVGDNMQSVYDKCYEYLEMDDRIEILNSRLQVLHELLDMLRLQGQAQHSDFLEVIIIVLICVDCVILLFTLAATLGWIGGEGGEGLHAALSTRWGTTLAALLPRGV